MRIIYMGTPDFAVESLKKLVEAGKNIVAVVTMPDKAAGRGHKLQYSPIKQYAIDNELNLLQPENLKSEDFLTSLRNLNADLQIVVAFRMLPEAVWNMPPLGTFNLHASLLPKYRGAAPINWAVINGEKETGITTFFLKHEIDTGNIIYQEKINISDTDTAGVVHDKLMVLGGKLVLKTVEDIEQGNVPNIPQKEIECCFAPKIFKDTCKMNFNNNCETIRNHVRGLSPYPAAWTNIIMDNGESHTIKIHETKNELCNHNIELGSIISDGKKYLKIAVNDGYVHLVNVQLSGKKRMNIEDLLRGLKNKPIRCQA